MKPLVRRLGDIVVTVAGLALVVLIVLRLQMANEATIGGTVRVIDGDTLALSGQSVRLAGIDAPELHQTCIRDGLAWPCGLAALQHLRALVGAGAVECVTSGRDKYSRLLGVCQSAGDDLNGAMVASGLAVAFGRYAREEASARDAKRGLWGGTFDLPKDWRATHGAGQLPVPADAGGGVARFLRNLFGPVDETGAADGDL